MPHGPRPLPVLAGLGLLVLGALCSPIAPGSAAPPRVGPAPKTPATRALTAAQQDTADRLGKLPPRTPQQKKDTLATLGVKVPLGQIGEPFELSPRRPYLDATTWLALDAATTYPAKNVALVVPVVGSATLRITPVRDQPHLVECGIDLQGHEGWVVQTDIRTKDAALARSVAVLLDNRVSFVIPAQSTVRWVEVLLRVGPLQGPLQLDIWDPPHFMLRACEITPVG